MKLFLVVFLILWVISPFYRTFIKNLHLSLYYFGKDTFFYFKEKQWEKFGLYGIDMFINMFGAGKTLSMTHRATQLYKQYGNSLRFISNYHLNDIPYIPLINFNQLMELGTDPEGDHFVGTVVLIDEISTVLSHRNFANFPIELLSVLLQQRKRHIYIMCTSQRFFMVDKIWRSITTRVIDCRKFWRFENFKIYDAWDYEQAINSNLLKYLNNSWWFIRDCDYNAYDTSEMISKQSAEDFISNEQAIIRKGLDQTVTDLNRIDKKRLRRRVRKPNPGA